MREGPVTGRFMLLVVSPQKRHQHVDIEQVNAQGKSLNASFTLCAVIFGDPFGGSKTTRPFTSRTAAAMRKPRRARSDTALPSETCSSAARLAASANMS